MAKPSKRKKLYLAPLLVIVLYGVVELLSLALYGIYYGELVSFEALGRRRAALTAGEGKQQTASQESEAYGGVLAPRIQHPYVGFLSRPGVPSGNLQTRAPFQGVCKINDNGFIGEGDFRRRGADEVHLLVVGGSFAHQAFCMSQARLVARLKTIPRLAGKKFKLFTFAAGSYKQPQQVMAVNYFLALGGKLDILINLDGYNELAFAGTGAHPVYPEKWEMFFIHRDQPIRLRLIGRIQVYRELARDAARLADVFGFSVTAGLAWSLVDDIIQGKIRQANLRLEQIAKVDKHRFDRDGPIHDIKDVNAFARELWYRSSLQLAALARAFDFKYYHFLQPNQFIYHSKTYSSSESKIVNEGDPKHRRWFNEQYAKMGAASSRFSSAQVNFLDLRYIFKAVKDTIYIDECCHVNKAGNDLLMERIGDHIVKDQQQYGERLQD